MTTYNHRTVACSKRVYNLSLTYSAYINVLAEFLIRRYTLVLTGPKTASRGIILVELKRDNSR